VQQEATQLLHGAALTVHEGLHHAGIEGERPDRLGQPFAARPVDPPDLAVGGGGQRLLLRGVADLDDHLRAGARRHRRERHGYRRQRDGITYEQMPIGLGAGPVPAAQVVHEHRIAGAERGQPGRRQPGKAVIVDVDRHFTGDRIERTHRVGPGARPRRARQFVVDTAHVEVVRIGHPRSRKDQAYVCVGERTGIQSRDSRTTDDHSRHFRGDPLQPLESRSDNGQPGRRRADHFPSSDRWRHEARLG
jgi:hypothetical protein